MTKAVFLFLLLFIKTTTLFSQQQFTYNYYTHNYVRVGILNYNVNENKAVYVDKFSELEEISDKEKENVVEMNSENKNSSNNFYYYKDNNHLTFTDVISKTHYLVEDNFPKMEWKLSPEKKIIQHLICYKATTSFRGRNWTAWYAPEIPIMYGPWKFYGLPGLIVEIKDHTEHFVFSLKEYVLNSTDNAPKVDVNSYKKVTMKEMVKLNAEAEEYFFNVFLAPSEGESVVDTIFPGDGNGIEAKYEWQADAKK